MKSMKFNAEVEVIAEGDTAHIKIGSALIPITEAQLIGMMAVSPPYAFVRHSHTYRETVGSRIKSKQQKDVKEKTR